MKTLIRFLLLLPLLSLGGCYTQFATHETAHNPISYDNPDQYAYDDQQADTTRYYDDDQGVPVSNYSGTYFPGHRRYFWNYYPTYGFSMGVNYDPFIYGLYGWDYYGGMAGYYWPWFYGGYTMSYFYGYNNWYGRYGHHFGFDGGSSNYRYRTGITSRTRGNDAGRGLNIDRSNPTGSRGSGAVDNGRVRERAGAPNLGNVRVGRESNTQNTVTRSADNSSRSSTARSAERANRSGRSSNGPARERVSSGSRSSGSHGNSSSGSGSVRSERPASSGSSGSSRSSSPSSSPRSEGGSRSGGSRDSGSERRR